MNTLKRKVTGITVVEFTLSSTVFFLILLSIFSVGHMMYSMQIVNEVTRQSARLAAVCWVADQNEIPQRVVDNLNATVVDSNDITIEYLDDAGAVVSGDLTQQSNFSQIYFVRARVTGSNYQLVNFLSFLGNSGLISIPEFETTIPRENLGVMKDVGYTDC